MSIKNIIQLGENIHVCDAVWDWYILSFWVRSSCVQIKELFLITEKSRTGMSKKEKRVISVNPYSMIMDTCLSNKGKKKNSNDTDLGVLHITLHSCKKAEYGESALWMALYFACVSCASEQRHLFNILSFLVGCSIWR